MTTPAAPTTDVLSDGFGVLVDASPIAHQAGALTGSTDPVLVPAEVFHLCVARVEGRVRRGKAGDDPHRRFAIALWRALEPFRVAA